MLNSRVYNTKLTRQSTKSSLFLQMTTHLAESTAWPGYDVSCRRSQAIPKTRHDILDYRILEYFICVLKYSYVLGFLGRPVKYTRERAQLLEIKSLK